MEGGKGEGNKENCILRRVNYGEERGAIDCIVIRGEAKKILLGIEVSFWFRNSTVDVIR